ncbi:TauD/TfdA family dioxygenase [Roseibium polysiphoniae]|uniref:TauD/TfdA family dioxygenase n=1 Tax=Roseibium polysiphoniae TaxID=2571221 RepID=A0ABR9C9A0_9HYPH|nr:TauD/TfdA family dioxygenase [Roseibium polysiphoniae]MBD8876489.1 TauD/TfdA family dioxygenase [Roseibium polysiphoniae]
MMTATLHGDARAIDIAWPDGSATTFPAIFLRDSCPSGFHPQTLERQFDLTSVPLDIEIGDASVDDGNLVLRWKSEDHTSRFDANWLAANKPGMPLSDPADVTPTLWRGDLTKAELPRASASDLLSDDAALLDFLVATKRTGLAIVDGMADDVDAGMTVARRIGFLRETNFGVTFEVQSKPNPNNLAYTSHALPLHTDLPNQELAPGFQFLHCLANEAEGGGSTFCDGFAIAEDLKASDPEAFRLLNTIPIPFRFQDQDYDLRSRHLTIETNHLGQVRELRFNAHIAATLDLEADVMAAYYAAYRKLMQMTRSDDYVMTTRLEGGEMVIFDNRRALHGRAAFDPSTGFRHLRGCYVDRGEFDSRIRVLSR